MSALATSHDLRCGALTNPSIPCNCARGAAVARLPVGRARGCGFCGQPGAFRIDRDTEACEAHAGAVLRHYFDTSWDGWQPCAVVPLRTGGAA